jgi:hypothetical protein
VAELVEGTGLENRHGGNPIGSSNLPSSAFEFREKAEEGAAFFESVVRIRSRSEIFLTKYPERVLNM